MSEIKTAQAQTFPPVDDATWRKAAEASLRGKGSFESRLVSRTLDGIEVQPLYTAHGDDEGFPGVAPFTRGSAAVPGEEAWEIRQEFASPDLKTSNTQILRDLDRGVSGVRLIFDEGFSREQRGASARGIPVRTVADLTQVLDGVHLSMVRLDLGAGLNGHGALALLARYADASGQALTEIRGTVGYDPLSQLLVDGRLAADAARVFDLGADLARYTRANAPGLRAIRVSGRAVQEAGASEAQEIAWALAAGIEWLRALTERGLCANDAAQSISFELSASRDIFLEISKLRAMRKIWARALEAIGVDEAFRAIDMHVRGSAATMSQRDPWVNMLRVTGHAFSAALGGATSVTTPAYDEAVAIPGAFGRRIARNTQLILRDESHLARIQDPAGGSYYLESMTQEYATLAWSTMQTIEAKGGAIVYAQSGALADSVGEVQRKRAQQIATRRMALTGVSEYPNLEERPVDTAALAPVTAAPAAGEATRTRAAIAAGTFDGAIVSAAIEDLAGGANSSAILATLASSAGLEVPALAPIRYAGPWEALRDAADGLAAKSGGFPQIFLANLGRIPEHRPRSSFAQNLFAAGGIQAENNDGFADVDAAVAAFRSSGLDVACICSTDANYEAQLPALAAGLRGAGARQIIVAGKPGAHEAAWRDAGATTFIYMGADALTIVRETLAGFGADVTAAAGEADKA